MGEITRVTKNCCLCRSHKQHLILNIFLTFDRFHSSLHFWNRLADYNDISSCGFHEPRCTEFCPWSAYVLKALKTFRLKLLSTGPSNTITVESTNALHHPVFVSNLFDNQDLRRCNFEATSKQNNVCTCNLRRKLFTE